MLFVGVYAGVYEFIIRNRNPFGLSVKQKFYTEKGGKLKVWTAHVLVLRNSLFGTNIINLKNYGLGK